MRRIYWKLGDVDQSPTSAPQILKISGKGRGRTEPYDCMPDGSAANHRLAPENFRKQESKWKKMVWRRRYMFSSQRIRRVNELLVEGTTECTPDGEIKEPKGIDVSGGRLPSVSLKESGAS